MLLEFELEFELELLLEFELELLLELLLEFELELLLEFELELELELLLELLLWLELVLLLELEPVLLLWLELVLLLWLELVLLLWLELALLGAGATARACPAARAERPPRICGGLPGGASAICCGSPWDSREMRALVAWSSSDRPKRGLNAEPTAMPSAPSAPA